MFSVLAKILSVKHTERMKSHICLFIFKRTYHLSPHSESPILLNFVLLKAGMTKQGLGWGQLFLQLYRFQISLQKKWKHILH